MLVAKREIRAESDRFSFWSMRTCFSSSGRTPISGSSARIAELRAAAREGSANAAESQQRAARAGRICRVRSVESFSLHDPTSLFAHASSILWFFPRSARSQIAVVLWLGHVAALALALRLRRTPVARRIDGCRGPRGNFARRPRRQAALENQVHRAIDGMRTTPRRWSTHP